MGKGRKEQRCGDKDRSKESYNKWSMKVLGGDREGNGEERRRCR